MFSIEIAAKKGWKNLWLETESQLVVIAFKDNLLVPWDLQNRWKNCLLLVSSMNLM